MTIKRFSLYKREIRKIEAFNSQNSLQIQELSAVQRLKIERLIPLDIKTFVNGHNLEKLIPVNWNDVRFLRGLGIT